VHFEDWFEGGEIRFDYLVKPGPVTRSNAIALMRAVGLEVPGESEQALGLRPQGPGLGKA
jgi:DNA mismatch repair ATPase MutS